MFPCKTWQLIPAPGSALKGLPKGTCGSYSDRFPKAPLALFNATDLHRAQPERQNSSRYEFTGSRFIPTLILAMDFWRFWLHSSSLLLKHSLTTSNQTHSFLHLSSYLSKPKQPLGLVPNARLTIYFVSLDNFLCPIQIICILFGMCSDALPNWSRCHASHVLFFCQFSFSRTICFQISEGRRAKQVWNGMAQFDIEETGHTCQLSDLNMWMSPHILSSLSRSLPVCVL